jgi:hypothetical protein
MLLARGFVSGNLVRFGKVRLQFSNVESETTLLIRAIAVNAAGLMPPALIAASVEILSPANVYTVQRPERMAVVAFSRLTLKFWCTPGNGRTASMPVKITSDEQGQTEAARLHFASQHPGGFRLSGEGRTATQFKAVFVEVFPGVSVWVATQPVGFPGGAYLVAEEGSSDPMGRQLSDRAGVPVAKLETKHFSAVAVWQVAEELPIGRDYEFPVFLSFDADATVSPLTIRVVGNLAPTPFSGLFTATTGSAASARLVIPRFTDAYAIVLDFVDVAPAP